MFQSSEPIVTSLELDHLEHRQPIPVGARVGNLVFSSAITGKDPVSGRRHSDPAAQIEQAFSNLRDFLRVAGLTPRQVGLMTVFLRDLDHREFLTREWVELYPDPEHRPARHVILTELERLHHDMVIQILVTAVAPNDR